MSRRDMPPPPLRLSLLCVVSLLALAPSANAAVNFAPAAATHSRTLAPGVVLTWHPQVSVAGSAVPAQLVTITWPLGDPRYRMRTVLTGGPVMADGFLRRGRLSEWGATQAHSLVAAISPDFATYLPGRAMPSGLEVAGRVIVHLPSAGAVAPSVGYTSGGRLVFGTVRAQPIAFQLPGGQTATGRLGVIELTHWLATEGVKRVIVTSEDPGDLAAATLPPVPRSQSRRATGRSS